MKLSNSFSLSPKVWLLLAALFIFGAGLRLTRGDEVEYKQDEAETLTFVKKVQDGAPWPWVGQKSSNGFFHPAFGIWLYIVPGLAFEIKTPVGLARVNQVLGCLGLLALLWFALTHVPLAEREYWLWAFALVCVNPTQILLERRIWHPTLLPLFCVIALAGWWRRDKRWSGAFVWGFFGTLLGQIHMSGFYFALTLAGWTYWRRKDSKPVHWWHWVGGSALGSLPLLLWISWLFTHESGDPFNFKFHRLVTFRYWYYWIRGAFGWNSKFTLGEESWLFFKWPIANGIPTYAIGFLHAVLFALMLYLFWMMLKWARGHKGKLFAALTTHSNDTRFLLNAAFLGCGLFATLSGIHITRYFFLATHPLSFVFLAYVFLRAAKNPRMWLGITVAAQLLISIAFSEYIHRANREINGDYHSPYRVLIAPAQESAK